MYVIFLKIYFRDPYTLVRCSPYAAKHNDISGIGTQPFALRVSPDALIVMDFHAHLLWREVIGFLAGNWDKLKRGMIAILIASKWLAVAHSYYL